MRIADRKIFTFIFIFSALCFLFFIKSYAQVAPLSSQIASLQSDSDLAHASWSICVMDVKKDSVIAEYNSNISLVPASVLKIITTASALAIMGCDFKYETYLEYDGKLDTLTGTLYGNVYIKGSGDPTLDSDVFRKKSDTTDYPGLTDQWAAIILSNGIKKIEGAVIADADNFETDMIPSTWIWGDMGNYYGAGACGLNFKDNKFSIYFKSGKKKGDTAMITEISPSIPNLNLMSFVKTGGYLDNVFIYGAPYNELRYVKGTIPANKNGYKAEGSMPDPPLFCAQSLDSSLRKIGVLTGRAPASIRILKSETTNYGYLRHGGKDDHKLQTTNRLLTHTSYTLDKIVYQTNLQSNNLFAESLLKTIAWKKTGFGEEQTGISIVTNYWKQKDIDLKGFYMADGCGLSRFNAISTKQLTKILSAITQDSVLFKNFYESLPIAGKSGSLGKLCKGTSAENNLRAKSGYMTRVRSYAGYVAGKKRNLITFAIIVNNYDCTPAVMKEKLEKLMVAIADVE